MSIYAQPAASFEATAQGYSTGLVGTVGVRILDGQGGTTTPRGTVGIVESPSGSGIYTATLTAPATAGTYVVVWDDGATYASEELVVTSDYFTPAAPSSTSSLCSVADVKATDVAGLANVGTDLDSLIADVIVEASRMILAHTGRRFAPTDTDPTVRLHEMGGAWRSREIPVTDLAAAPTLVRVLEQDAATLVQSLAATDYVALPLNREAWEPITTLRLLETAPVGPGLVLEVTGRHGWPEIPADVRRAAIITVVAWLRNDRALTNQSPDQFEPGSPPQRALPLAAVDILRLYRRPGLA